MFLEWIFKITIVLVCLLTVFPNYYFIFNILIVGLLFLHYFVSCQNKIKHLDVLVLFFSIFQVLISLDVSRISIFIFYLFLRSKNLYNSRLLKKCLTIMFIFFVVILIAYSFGFNQENDLLSWSRVEQGFIEEKSLGFTNPNRCMLFFFIISCLILLLTEKVRCYFFVFLTNIILYHFTQSRTYFYILILIIFLLLFMKWRKKENTYSFIGKIVPWAFLGLGILSVVLPYFFSDTYLNTLFTGRLVHNKEFLETGITLFGNSELETKTFDSSYLHMLLTKGAIYFVAFTILLFSYCKKTLITNKKAIIIMAIFGAAFMEVIFLESFIMLLIGVIINYNKTERAFS